MFEFFKLIRIKHEREIGKIVQPPFAGIILIRYAGIISALRFKWEAPR